MRLWEIYHWEVPALLTEMAETPAMQRLKNVGMNCGCEYTHFPMFVGREPYSRFDHSVGVGLIVWHFTGDKVQAMAGLLHDIATPVFAHVVDFLHGDYLRQESTENATASVIRNTDQLCAVLRKYGLTVASVEDYHRYPVADNEAPRLSADRLEYTLGNAVEFGFITRAQAAEFYNDLTVDKNEFGQTELVFRHGDLAADFAFAALKCSKLYVSDPDRYAMQMLSELLRDAIHEEVLYEEDLYQDEVLVIEKLKKSAFADRWMKFCGYSKIFRSQIRPDGDGWRQIFSKKRCIDPYIKNVGRLSELDRGFNTMLRQFRISPQDDWLYAK